jgi:RNA polymerase sigma-70 factor (ECF subfamily)
LKWKDGEETAFEVLYKRHVSEILAIAYRKVAETESAEDLVQDSFISLYKQKFTITTAKA